MFLRTTRQILFYYCLWLCLLYPCIVMDSVPLRRIIQKFRFIMGTCIKSTGLQKTDISKLRIAKVNKQLNKYHNAH
ncbi:hypothetical protein L211DRAFT_610292 [Terfezia boudieri ATCC MYA-4762]|uniref:Uncharacterized protein n=1 Tax=Terfezia boudieri ATCC MYA-4762 TaxID=1051890 RepID=A0A3N4M173_9PEZI|nr:hypothetical protein L211DRAFT_610292 [Terfezia boudieri ATCC MYA-4762]